MIYSQTELETRLKEIGDAIADARTRRYRLDTGQNQLDVERDLQALLAEEKHVISLIQRYYPHLMASVCHAIVSLHAPKRPY